MKIFDTARPKYGKILEKVLDLYSIKRIMALEYNTDIKGSVRVDVLTTKEEAYSFSYYYGNLDYGQDEWDGRSDTFIMKEIVKTAKHFKNIRDYTVWRTIELFDR